MIQEKLKKYIQLNKQFAEVRKQQTASKKLLKELEAEIKQYMSENEMESISLDDGEIVMYGKKIPQTFKKESIVETLTEKLKDSNKAEELTESILSNKKFIVEDKIKAVLKKK